MTKYATSIRLDDLTRQQLDELTKRYNTTQARIVSTAIDRMYREEKQNMTTKLTDKQALEMADKIYLEVYGEIDDKYFQDEKVGEIRDWLQDGDLADSPDLDELVTEWREYDEEDIAERIG